MDSAFGFWIGGIAEAVQPTNLLFAIVGCTIGTLVGVLPGLGPAAALARHVRTLPRESSPS